MHVYMYAIVYICGPHIYMCLQEGGARDACLGGERGIGAGRVLHAEDALGPVREQ